MRTALGGLLTLGLMTLSACSDTPDTPTPKPPPAIDASGALTAHFKAVDLTPCSEAHGILTVRFPAASGTSHPLLLTIRTYHGTGEYTDLLGPAAVDGLTVEADGDKGERWVGSSGLVTVTEAVYTRIIGTMNVTARPFAGPAAGTVTLTGTWECTVTPSPSTTP